MIGRLVAEAVYAACMTVAAQRIELSKKRPPAEAGGLYFLAFAEGAVR
jgi:hypothetical protein